MSKQILAGSDACVLRVPSYLSMLLCREFIRTKRPYAVEVVGDPWSQLAPGSFASRLRPIIRRKSLKVQGDFYKIIDVGRRKVCF